MGGQANSFIVRCRYTFRHDDGTVSTIDGEIRIAQVTTYNQAYPSLLGRDVLQYFGLSVALSRNEVLLDYLV